MNKLYTAYQICSVEGICHGLYVLWMLHHGLDALQVSLIISLGEGTLLFSELPTGWWADRFGLRRSLLIGSALQVLGLVAMWANYYVVSALAIALGDAFRHGADEALLYRSDPVNFQQNLARAQSLTLLAQIFLTLGGGLLATRCSYHLAWGLEVLLASVGLGLACKFPDFPMVAEQGSGRKFGAWLAVLPFTLLFALAAGGEFVVQASASTAEMAGLRVSGILGLEALGAALVARWRVPPGCLLLLVSAALVWRGPALGLIFLVAGMAPSLRSRMLQQVAGEDERARVQSAASTLDMLARMLILPLAGRLISK